LNEKKHTLEHPSPFKTTKEFIGKIFTPMLVFKEIQRRREVWRIANERETTLKAKKRLELDGSTDSYIRKMKFSSQSEAGSIYIDVR